VSSWGAGYGDPVPSLSKALAQPNPGERERRCAVRCAAGNALDAADCALLLEALGLDAEMGKT
jgi:hypothetical protein